MGLELTEHWGRGGFIKKEKESIRVLGPQARTSLPRDGGGPGKGSMIDVLHRCLLLWERGERKAIGELLAHTGYGGQDVFWRVAQAISDVLPEGDKERQLLQGLLCGREQYARAAAVERAEQLGLDLGEEAPT